MKPVNEAALDAFIKLIAEKGFAEVALRDVAQAAGLGLAELYRVYPDKVALASCMAMSGVSPSLAPAAAIASTSRKT